jgi:hypothetical protein
MAQAAPSPAQQAQQAAQKAMMLNIQQRQSVVGNSVLLTQPIPVNSRDPTSNNPAVTITPKNVGLILGFMIRVSGTLTNNAGGSATRSELGGMNLVTNFTFTDLSNNVRINTPGWHIGMLNSARQGFVFGGAYAPNVGADFGNNWNVQTCPSSIAASTDAAVSQYYYVPLAYSQSDLRGAIYAAVTNGTMSLQINLNLSPFTTGGADATLNVFSTAAANGNWKTGTNIAIECYQVYYDQLPTYNDGPLKGQVVLPALDLNTIYTLKQTAQTGLTSGQDFSYNFTNYNDFLSALTILDNNGTLGIGADINYWSMKAANTLTIFQYTPQTAALYARQTFMSDLPKGCYYFDFRARPISTNQFGNMQLNVNPTSSINAAAILFTAVESFTYPNSIQGQSLPNS